MSQTNIKEVLVKEAKSDEKAFEIELDTSIDKELEKEGYSRELIRRIQGLRKKSGLKKHDKINLIISSKLDLKGFEKEISSICGAKTLKFNEVKKEEYKDKFKVKGKEFEIGFDVIK